MSVYIISNIRKTVIRIITFVLATQLGSKKFPQNSVDKLWNQIGVYREFPLHGVTAVGFPVLVTGHRRGFHVIVKNPRNLDSGEVFKDRVGTLQIDSVVRSYGRENDVPEEFVVVDIPHLLVRHERDVP